MNIVWNSISEELNESIYRSYELIESLLNEDADSIEIAHWWKFLSAEISDIPTERLLQEARRIKERGGNQDKMEIEYCNLLKIEKPLIHHWIGPHIKLRRIPTEYDTIAWIFRWIYTYTGHSHIIQL